jgi:hypothetical protein
MNSTEAPFPSTALVNDEFERRRALPEPLAQEAKPSSHETPLTETEHVWNVQ